MPINADSNHGSIYLLEPVLALDILVLNTLQRKLEADHPISNSLFTPPAFGGEDQ